MLSLNTRTVLQMDLAYTATVLAAAAWNMVLLQSGWMYRTRGRRALRNLDKLLRWYHPAVARVRERLLKSLGSEDVVDGVMAFL